MYIKEPKDPTLRHIRELAGISQREVAARILVDHSIISQKELNRKLDDLPLHYIRSVVEACGGTMQVVIKIADKTIIR